jgi:Icc-related predicted phosphoesterase
VSHQPPLGYGDALPGRDGREGEHIGSAELLECIDRIRPKAVVCGHIHSGYGCYRRGGTAIYNVAVADEQYRLVHGATEILLD